jgi:Na+/proline symporter
MPSSNHSSTWSKTPTARRSKSWISSKRWSIPFIAAFLLLADYVYFDALRDPEALISVVSSLRRASTLVAFAGGIWWFREARGAAKLPAVLGILCGIVLTLAG